MAEMTIAAGMEALVFAQGGHVEDEHIVIVLAVFCQGMLNDTRCRRCMTHYHTVAVVDVGDGFCRGRNFLFIFFFPVHNSWYILMTLVTLKKALPTAAKEKT